MLIDVRETQEYEGGRLPNAIHIPLSQLASRGDELARYAGRPVIAYCMIGQPQPDGERGARAPRLQGRLQPAGRLPGLEGRGAAGGEVTLPTVTMYSTAVCPYCIQAERFLKAKGVTTIATIRVDLDPGARRTMMERTGRRTVPQIYIDDFHVGGYEDLVALDHAGRLAPLLAGRAA